MQPRRVRIYPYRVEVKWIEVRATGIYEIATTVTHHSPKKKTRATISTFVATVDTAP